VTNPEYIPVTAAVMRREGKVLIAKRKRAFAGYPWEFPGGKLEENETLQECLKRELREELGIEVKVGELVALSKHVLNCQQAISLYAYEVTYLSGDLTLKDHEEIRWVTIDELDAYSFPEPDRVIVKALKDKKGEKTAKGE
jgi:mutator protein MutT